MAAGAGWLSCGKVGPSADGGVPLADAGVDAAFDAGIDAAVDAGTDASVDLGADLPLDTGAADAAMDAGPFGTHVTVTSTGTLGACPDWVPVADPTPRVLPSDPTPRVLWERPVAADPVFAGAVGATVMLVSIGPDGNIWAVGPSPVDIAMFDRDGRGVFVTPDLVTWEHGAPPSLPPAIAPDGSAFVSVTDEAGSTARVVRVRPDGSVRTMVSTPAPGVTWIAIPTLVTVGPHGVLYASQHDGSLAGVCGTDAVSPWVRTARYDDGTPALLGAARGNYDGTALVNWSADSVLVFDHDGVARAPFFTLDAVHRVSLSAFDADDILYGTIDATSHVEFHLRHGTRDQILPMPIWNEGSMRLTPDGGVWSIPIDVTGTLRFWRDGTTVVARTPTPVVGQASVGTDGSLVAVDVSGSVVRLSPSDGHTMWSVPIAGDRPGPGALDVDGVFYTSGSVLRAVQTDVLPALGGCYEPGCDARHSGTVLTP